LKKTLLVFDCPNLSLRCEGIKKDARQHTKRIKKTLPDFKKMQMQVKKEKLVLEKM
jgi:hypothetical protein